MLSGTAIDPRPAQASEAFPRAPPAGPRRPGVLRPARATQSSFSQVVFSSQY